MDKRPVWAAMISIALASFPAYKGLAAETPIVAGWIENGWVHDPAMTFNAKLDTGAKTTSIHAPDAEILRKNGKRFAKFTLKTRMGRTMALELPVVRIASIKNLTGPSIKRAVVRIRLCVAGEIGEVEVNLSSRSEFNNRLLVGRTFLADRILVDSSRTRMHPGKCRTTPK